MSLLSPTEQEREKILGTKHEIPNKFKAQKPNVVTSAWIRLTKRIGLGGIRLHDARHTHASLMLKQGIHPKIVQERLGHSTIFITLDTYSHVVPGLQQAAANRLDEILVRKIEHETVDELV